MNNSMNGGEYHNVFSNHLMNMGGMSSMGLGNMGGMNMGTLGVGIGMGGLESMPEDADEDMVDAHEGMNANGAAEHDDDGSDDEADLNANNGTNNSNGAGARGRKTRLRAASGAGIVKKEDGEAATEREGEGMDVA
jgi:hypothetical protein